MYREKELHSMFQGTANVGEEYLVGWNEIRVALRSVEKLRRKGNDARVEVINSMGNTTLRVTLRSERELEEYFNSHLRRLILNGLTEDRSCVSGRILVSQD
jgi:hypothetical protein